MKIDTDTVQLSDKERQLIERIDAYICENLEEKISLSYLSSRFNISGTSIKRLFKLHHGEPVYTYIRCKKMEEAARLLVETGDSILAIAGMVGYENGSKFAKAFHDVIGMTPKSYRESRRKE